MWISWKKWEEFQDNIRILKLNVKHTDESWSRLYDRCEEQNVRIEQLELERDNATADRDIKKLGPGWQFSVTTQSTGLVSVKRTALYSPSGHFYKGGSKLELLEKAMADVEAAKRVQAKKKGE